MRLAFHIVLPLCALLTAAALGATAGIQVTRMHYRAQIAATQRAALLQALTLEQQARSAADQVQLQLDRALAANAALTQEKTHAIATVTTGRACLGGPALRLLDGAPGLHLGQLPGAAGRAAAADATAAADPGAPDTVDVVSTDADIATWALAAGEQYEQCRARIGALIDYHHRTAAKDGTP